MAGRFDFTAEQRAAKAALTGRMLSYYAGDPKRAFHLLKVRDMAALIAEGERLDADRRFVTECAALVHDIGIKPAEEKYGSCGGKLQEQEGPAPCRAMLDSLGFEKNTAERICYLVAHHHTYSGVDGIDYRILIEADFLVNAYEDGLDADALRAGRQSIFRTASGAALLETLYGEN